MSKSPVTVRLSDETHSMLKKLAEMSKTTVTELIASSIDEVYGHENATGEIPSRISAEDLKKVAAVVDVVGRPVPLAYVLQTLELQQKE